MTLTSEDIEWFREAKKIVQKGYYPDGKKAISDYNRIFAEEIKQGKMRGNLSSKCGGCIRTAVSKVNEAIDRLENEITGKEDDGQKTKKDD